LYVGIFIFQFSTDTRKLTYAYDFNVHEQNKIHMERIRPFGDEDLTMLSPVDFYKGMTQGTAGIIDLLEKVNFHGNYPQNHNIVINNASSSVCMLYLNDWATHTKREVWVKVLKRHFQWCDAFVRVYHEHIDPRTVEEYKQFKKESGPDMKWIRKNFGLAMVKMALQHKRMIKRSFKAHTPKEVAAVEAREMEVGGFNPPL